MGNGVLTNKSLLFGGGNTQIDVSEGIGASQEHFDWPPMLGSQASRKNHQDHWAAALSRESGCVRVHRAGGEAWPKQSSMHSLPKAKTKRKATVAARVANGLSGFLWLASFFRAAFSCWCSAGNEGISPVNNPLGFL